MAVFSTGDIELPDSIIKPWLDKISYGSTVATLVTAAPMTYGTEKAMVWDWGEAEYVGEGSDKSSSTWTNRTMTTAPYKFQKTARYTQEIMWADEDEQLQILAEMLNSMTPALGRALDFGVFHGINPLTGARVPAMTTKLSDTTNTVELAAGQTFEALDAADLLVIDAGYSPSSIAVDPSFAAAFTTKRVAATGQKLYPDFTLSTAPSQLEGHRASTSRTVGAVGVATAPTNVKAFVGDFDTIRWGVQRRIGMEIIEYGDPDGQGDLKRKNQVAARLEILYGWGFADVQAITKIVDAA